MKKSLIALAALATVGAAQAQSNVTIYGIVDTGVVNITNVNNAGDSTTSVNSGVSHTSRLGFRGTEDLGGGMKANFNLEAGLGNDTGAMGAAGNTNNGAGATNEASSAASSKIFDRQATVGLEIGKFRVDLGRQNSLMVDSVGATDPLGFTFVAYNPNVVYTVAGALPGTNGYGASSHLYSTTTTATNLFRLDNSAKAQYSIGASRIGVMYSAGEVANNSAGNIRAINGSTKVMGATLTASYQAVQNAATPKAELKGSSIGAVVPVGKFEIRATLGEQKFETAAAGRTRVTGLGVGYPVTSATTVTAIYYNADNNSTDAALKGELDQYGVVVQHNLSKRTGLYATAMSRKYKDGTSIFRASTASNKDSDMITAVGLRHSF